MSPVREIHNRLFDNGIHNFLNLFLTKTVPPIVAVISAINVIFCKKNEMGRSCGVHGNEKCIAKLEVKRPFRNFGIAGQKFK
jgi:hypothetical protein